jgi:hypothetical protein
VAVTAGSCPQPALGRDAGRERVAAVDEGMSDAPGDLSGVELAGAEVTATEVAAVVEGEPVVGTEPVASLAPPSAHPLTATVRTRPIAVQRAARAAHMPACSAG